MSPADGGGKKGRRGNLKGEQLYCASLMDERLMSQEDAIYFVLRGIGVKVSSQSGQPMPEITINSAEMPTLFMRLRKMGMKAHGRIITLSPKPGHEEQEAAKALANRSLSEMVVDVEPGSPNMQHGSRALHAPSPPAATRPSAPTLLYTSPCFSAGMQSSGRTAYRPGSPTAEEQESLFQRLSLPKHAAAKHPFRAAIVNAMNHDPVAEKEQENSTSLFRRSQQDRLATTLSQEIGFSASTSSSTARKKPIMLDCPWEPEWSPKPAAANAAEQRKLHSIFAQPKQQVAQSRSLPTLPTKMDPSSAGSRAQREFEERRAKLHAHQDAAQQSRLQAELEAQHAREAETIHREIAKLEAQAEAVKAAWDWAPPPDPRKPFARAFEHRLLASFQASPDTKRRDSAPAMLADQGEHDYMRSSQAFGGVGPQRGMVGWQLAQGGADGETSAAAADGGASRGAREATGDDDAGEGAGAAEATEDLADKKIDFDDPDRERIINSAPGRMEVVVRAPTEPPTPPPGPESPQEKKERKEAEKEARAEAASQAKLEAKVAEKAEQEAARAARKLEKKAARKAQIVAEIEARKRAERKVQRDAELDARHRGV